MKLLGSLKSLITEIAAIDDMQNGIKQKMVMIIYYNDKKPEGRGFRTIEPVCLGYSKAGNLVLRAWEREGASYSASKEGNILPGWRLFRLDKILSNKPTGEVYNEIRPGYNLNGDKSMVSVIINAKFDNVPPQETPQPTQQPQETQTTPSPTPTPQT
jgi:predicted DNA-binding transcriptional regulator YafY